jgi:NADH-quinone oxidoreductase subunit J
MTFIHLIFYLFSTIAILSGMMVVASANPVRGALFLVLTFFAMAGIWLLLEAEFLALILVLVYVGAVMTLFLFVVMMLQVNVVSMKEGFVKYWWLWAAPLVLIVLALMIKVVGPEQFGLSQLPAPVASPANYNNLIELGSALYTDYAYPFEIAAVLLLTAIVAAISLTHRKPKSRKAQEVSKQVSVQRKDRVRLVNMPSVKKLTNKPADTGE